MRQLFSVEDILQCADPIQRLCWNEIFLRMGENVSIKQHVEMKISVDSDLVNEVPGRLWFAYQLDVSCFLANEVTPDNPIVFLGTGSDGFQLSFRTAVFDQNAMLVVYASTHVTIKNVWFTALDITEPLYLSFKGFRCGN
jgi:hypothetical protein